MKGALRIVLSSLAGVVAWFVVATVGDLVLRVILAGYFEAEHVWAFTPVMLAARLVLGVISTVGSGLVAALTASAGTRTRAWLALTILLLLGFVPQHVFLLWPRFPIWYHATFLATLLIGPWLGSRAAYRSTGGRAGNDAGDRVESHPSITTLKD